MKLVSTHIALCLAVITIAHVSCDDSVSIPTEGNATTAGPVDECRPTKSPCGTGLVCSLGSDGYFDCLESLDLGDVCGIDDQSTCGEGLTCIFVSRFDSSRCVWSEPFGPCDMGDWTCAPGLACLPAGFDQAQSVTSMSCMQAECSAPSHCDPCETCSSDGQCVPRIDCKGNLVCAE